MTLYDKESRLEAFEKMLSSVRSQYTDTISKMSELKKAGREKSATYRQMMGNKMQLKNMLAMYQMYELIDDDS
ncbi:hypothetical protein [Ruminococcus sp. Marseille-P6503]|uniref:hypothetical protein n=1 Tax=Ruminococcus sp. Marseille-P6503 TaxID=2364796 RepID=UPI000F53E3C2|nr:hypothetical protein [Ruminococcus sp. Marseille-P6503]